ncbi:hypothetical protein H5410_031888 [Solanum commersonii]|uniref:Transposon protein, CACTA, En/Spm sub-class n=1 Tax=Solanum commersonii TaxID=4109 RepID=A0A9J5YNQ7_SOLCO|nr:hypothetical protein H5410_031888 [Solanum commersonii]
MVEQMDDDIFFTFGCPIKTESEDSSTTKTTIRYTFVAPSAIGKGRGRGQGLKSLGENGSIPTKKLFSQSNNLVNHYIQEIETNKIYLFYWLNEKLYSTRMETMHKNALTLEKENMKSSIPSPACTNQVKQYTQEVKTRTRSNSTMSSSQEMRTMDKNPLICEEDMQINISLTPSVDQVMKHSETTEKGSSNSKKVKGVRGSNMCKEVVALEIGQKLTVTFYNNQIVGTKSKLFSRHLRKIIRDRNICPLEVSSWNDIKHENLNHMWVAVEHKFEAVDINDHRDHILGWKNELWNKWRGHLHAKYVKDKPIHQTLRTIPRGVDKKEWKWLVKGHFTSESFQAQLKEMVQADSSLPSIEIVEKCCGPQTRTHVFGFGGGVKAKDLKGGNSSKAELFSALRSTREDSKCLNEENTSLNEENKSLNHRLSTLEDAMKEIMKMKELFATQQSHVQPTTSPVSTE